LVAFLRTLRQPPNVLKSWQAAALDPAKLSVATSPAKSSAPTTPAKTGTGVKAGK
jgi:hypothetical protein